MGAKLTTKQVDQLIEKFKNNPSCFRRDYQHWDENIGHLYAVCYPVGKYLFHYAWHFDLLQKGWTDSPYMEDSDVQRVAELVHSLSETALQTREEEHHSNALTTILESLKFPKKPIEPVKKKTWIDKLLEWGEQ